MGGHEVVHTRHSCYRQQPNSIDVNSDFSFELINKKEVSIKTRKNTQKETKIKLNQKLNFKSKLITFYGTAS